MKKEKYEIITSGQTKPTDQFKIKDDNNDHWMNCNGGCDIKELTYLIIRRPITIIDK